MVEKNKNIDIEEDMVKVFNNFINYRDFLNIKNTLLSDDFPWFLNDYVLENSDHENIDNFQFVHNFYMDDSVWSNFFNILSPIIKKIDPLTLLRVKANLLPRTEKNIEHGMHVDILDSKSTTAVFYINDNNGYTLFENGKKIYSKENTIAIFPSKTKHTGSSCTDKKSRIVINFNYIQKDISALS